jgi:hypothetical protein
MSKALKNMTPEELAEHKENKALRSRARSFKTKILHDCKEGG